MTNQERIIFYLRDLDSWVLEGKIRSIETPYGFIGFRGDRDCRELVRKGLLEKRMNGKFSEVRFRRNRITLPPAYAPKQPETARML